MRVTSGAERPEQPGQVGVAAEPVPRFAPQRIDAGDFGGDFGRRHKIGKALLQIHRTPRPQRREPRMHFGGDRIGQPARRQLARPEPVMAALVGQPKDDRQTVPDRGLAIPKHRHLARRHLGLAGAGCPFGRVHRHQRAGERQHRQLRRQPATHRPARIGTIGNDQFHGRSPARCLTSARQGRQAPGEALGPSPFRPAHRCGHDPAAVLHKPDRSSGNL